MPIPAFDSILNILPPHLGDPCKFTDLSPFRCSVEEFCDHFATTAKRKQILSGFLKFRAELFNLGIVGFQWLSGSFVEDIESQVNRDPGDVDVVTFAEKPMMDRKAFWAIIGPRPQLWNPPISKSVFFVDHYLVVLGSPPVAVVQDTRYWYGLFSHRRRDGLWKGMLEVELKDKTDDDKAQIVLTSKP